MVWRLDGSSYHEQHMRVGCIALLMLAAYFLQAQPEQLVTTPVGSLSIPAELTKTVRADKAHRGDPVEFTTLEAVLINPKLVMPPHSKLFGRVVGAAPRQGDKPSWLVLLVERAEWKQHSVPLHAFIASQINLVPAPKPNVPSVDATDTSNNPRRNGRMSGRVAAETDSNLSQLTKPPQDASGQEVTTTKPLPLNDLRIVRDKDGITYLFSSKSDVKLVSGSLFMLKNQPTTGPDQSAAAVSH